MNASIRTRLVVAMDLLVVGVGVAVGWAGIEVVGRSTERRLVDEAARNAAGLFETMRLPLSPALMARLEQVLGTPVAAGPAKTGDLAATSLPEPAAGALSRRLAEGTLPRHITLAGEAYVVGTARVDAAPGPPQEGVRLYLLVPQREVEAAKRAGTRVIAWVTGAAIVLATVVATALAAGLVRPIRRLADRMYRIAQEPPQELLTDRSGAPRAQGPAELVRLAGAFDELLARLETAREQLARSARLATLGQLAASVAHELRNPLSGIKMNARVLADELRGSGAADESFDRMVREIDRMDLYLQELLDLAAGDAERGPLDRSKLSERRLDGLAESVLALVEGRCRHQGVTVETDWDPGGVWVRGDETLLRQVVLNLVLNALDAMPQGGRMRIEIRPGESENAVRLAVRDTGGGVEVPPGRNLFDPFVTTKTGGVGLGLYVARQNIARHGGHIGHESGPEGAVFWFEIGSPGP